MHLQKHGICGSYTLKFRIAILMFCEMPKSLKPSLKGGFRWKITLIPCRHTENRLLPKTYVTATLSKESIKCCTKTEQSWLVMTYGVTFSFNMYLFTHNEKLGQCIGFIYQLFLHSLILLHSYFTLFYNVHNQHFYKFPLCWIHRIYLTNMETTRDEWGIQDKDYPTISNHACCRILGYTPTNSQYIF